MKDLDKRECVRPVLSSHTGTARLNGTGMLSEESEVLPEVHLSLIAGFGMTIIQPGERTINFIGIKILGNKFWGKKTERKSFCSVQGLLMSQQFINSL